MKNKRKGETDLMSGPSGNDVGGMKKTLSIRNFFIIGFGAIISIGWALLVGDWTVIRGGPVATMVAFAIGAVFLFPIGAVFGELAAAIPISGGIIGYVDRTYGRYVSYMTGWFLALGNGVLYPWEIVAVSTLISNMFGGLFPILRAARLYTIMGADVYLLPTIIALGFAVYVALLNFRRVNVAAKLQAFLAKALLVGMLLVMTVSLVKGRPSNILPSFAQVEGSSTVTSTSNMFTGAISVLAMTPFSYTGFDTIPQQAKEVAEGLDWNRFGRVINVAFLAAGGFYMICIHSFGTIIPWTDFIKNTVPALACLKSISMFLCMAMLVIATLDPMGPTNSFYGATSRVMLVMGRREQLPNSFAVLDEKSGVPKMANTVLAILTIMGPFLERNMLVSLTNVSALAFIFSCTMVNFACLKMCCAEPDLPRLYKVPDGEVGVCMTCFAGIIIVGLVVVPFSPAALKPVGWAIVAAWLVIGLGPSAVTRAKGSNKAAAVAE